MTELARREFFTCCAMGACAAAVVSIAPLPSAAATTAPDAAWLQSQLDAVRVRYAKLLGAIGQELTPEVKSKLLQAMGRECAIQYRSITFDKYQGNIRGFLDAVQQPSGWVEKAEYDEQAGTIRIVDRHPKCSCPLVKPGETSPDQCECTLGWQMETYSRIIGKPVIAEVEESILRGGSRCVFRITIKKS